MIERASRMMVTLAILGAPCVAQARDVPVSDATALRAAIDAALPGDVILLADGTYAISGNVACDTAGTEAMPIVVRSVTPLGATIRFDALEGFHVTEPYWRFEGLDITGVCADDSACEHAFHLAGDADHTIIRGNRVRDFNAHIKSNGAGDPRAWPDDVLVEGNELYDTRPRRTGNPVTTIDVVGGDRWVIRANYIHDRQKDGGDTISYAAFLKGNGEGGLIERNLVVCERLHSGGVRLGLSFGGGGTSPDSICQLGTCSPEHRAGVMRNNVIVDCPADVGIYVNECEGCRVLHNTLIHTTGIDVRFAASDVEVIGNVLSGRVRARDGATLMAMGNREMVSDAEWLAWVRDPSGVELALIDGAELVDLGSTLPDVRDDYCGRARSDGMPDLGAIEYDTAEPCDTTRPPLGGVMPGMDGGVPDGDGGTSGVDASGLDGGGTPRDGGGAATASGSCGCRVGRASGAAPMGALALLVTLLGARRRRSPRC